MRVATMAYDPDYDDISWLTQSDSGNPNFNICEQFMDTSMLDDNVVSLEDNGNQGVEIYQGVFAEPISDDEAIDAL